MSSERWTALSDWHNQWLDAEPEAREQLRRAFAAAQPQLVAEAEALAGASTGLDGFLETPAWLLAARETAADISLIAADTMVGPYRVGDLLARGGMGDVYRATDLRLQRDVALKVLAHAQRGDSQGIDRFVQEGRITAALDHPNIVRLFDVGVFEDRPYLVTELLEGQTLRHRIESGMIPHDEARRIAEEMARGLVAAHHARLVHRDLKPENVFLTRTGQTKLLDFGIAKLGLDTNARDGLATLTGVLFGTAGYLSPEQVKGEAVDGRADLFALGAILFEMLTGRRAFKRDHTIGTLHAIVHDPPPDLLDGDHTVPPALAAIVTRLLEKEPADRFQTATDLAWALAESSRPLTSIPRAGKPAAPTEQPRRAPWIRIATAAAVVAALGYGGWRAGRSMGTAPDPLPTRFTWSLPAGLSLNSPPVVSPDGRTIAFAGTDEVISRLFVRRLNSIEATPIAGTEGGKQPFWSPDSLSLGFFARGKLMKITVAGGVPVVICDAPDGRGGAWSPSGVIVFGPDLLEAPLFRVSVDGGPVEAATRLDLSHGENAHRWPVFLPDGVHFLYFNRSSDDARRGIYVGRVDRPAELPGAPLIRAEAEAVLAPPLSPGDPSLLLYASNGRVAAQPFDAGRLALVGDARTIDIAVGGNTLYNPAMLSVSTNALAFAASAIPYGYRLASVARSGTDVQLSPDREAQNWPRLSPDGRYLARQRIDPVRGNPDIWVDDLPRGTRVRVTTSPDNDVLPVWSPDSRRLAYLSGRATARHLSIAAADGTGVVRDLPCPGEYCEPTEWSPDGGRLVVNVRDERGSHVWTIPVDAAGAPAPLLADAFIERDARFSRDGRWVAYVSEESGRAEVSVQSLTGSARRFVISAGGGDQPVWRRDGAELFFVDPAGRLHTVSVRPAADGGLTFGDPVALTVPAIGAGHWGTQYDVSPDGSRMYFLQGERRPAGDAIGVIIGWRASSGGVSGGLSGGISGGVSGGSSDGSSGGSSGGPSIGPSGGLSGAIR